MTSRDANIKKYLVFVCILIIFVLLAWLLIKLISSQSKKNQPKPIPVVVAPVQSANVPVFYSALGSVTSTDTVTIKSQVNGTLLRVLYREGQMVKANQLLAEIDPRPFLALLTQYQGALARDTAQLANARIDLTRYQQLYPQGAISQQVLETQQALVKQLEGTIQFDQGQIQSVQVDLIYTKIIAPIDGRVGLRLVDPGNYVQTTDTTGLVVLNRVQPITVVFALPEDNIPQVLQAMMHKKTLPVKAFDRAQQKLLETGTLMTIDNQINSATGTVNLRALFPNKNLSLFPNQFVNVNLKVNTILKATIVPTAAIQHGPNGDFVYLLNKNHTVKIYPVKVGIVYGDYTVINEGLKSGQYAVVEGADQLNNGSKVTIAQSGS